MTSEDDEEDEYVITYSCYSCGHLWDEMYSCACDSECPVCEAKNVSPLSYHKVDDYEILE